MRFQIFFLLFDILATEPVSEFPRDMEVPEGVQMICLDGVYHGFGGFQSDEALDIVDRFIREKIG